MLLFYNKLGYGKSLVNSIFDLVYFLVCFFFKLFDSKEIIIKGVENLVFFRIYKV